MVYGLPEDIRERELEELYYRCGRVEYIEIRRSATSRRLYGVVAFADERDAEYARDPRGPFFSHFVERGVFLLSPRVALFWFAQKEKVSFFV